MKRKSEKWYLINFHFTDLHKNLTFVELTGSFLWLHDEMSMNIKKIR